MIENIIFDLGGVLFRIDYNRTFNKLSSLLGYDLSVGNWPEWFKENVFAYETGKIHTEQFLWVLQHKSEKSPAPHAIDLIKAWNSMLIGWEEGVFQMIESLQKDYRLFILSNISPLHIQFLEKSLKKEGGLKYLHRLFEGIYFSNELKYRKPDIRCFQHIIEKHNLNPQSTLYIDDYPKNILEVKRIGVKCVVHNVKENIKNQINPYLNIVC